MSSDSKTDRDRFLMKLGFALALWQNVEFALGQIFNHLLRPTDDQSSRIVFSVMDLTRKLQSIKNLIEHKIEDATIKENWVAIDKTLRKQQSIRNNLVHWQHVVFVSDDRTENIITSSVSDERNIDHSKKSIDIFRKYLTEDDLDSIDKKFGECGEEVRKFLAELQKHLSSQ